MEGYLTVVDVTEQQRLEDPFARLEKEEEDIAKASEQHQIISKLYDLSHRQWSDPWSMSKKLRKTFREEKKLLKAKSTLTEDIRKRNGLHIELLPEAEVDAVQAKKIEYEGPEGREAALRRRELKTGSLVLGKRNRNGEPKQKELERVVKINTRERTDPFLNGFVVSEHSTLNDGVKLVKKRDGNRDGSNIVGLIDGYSSESE